MTLGQRRRDLLVAAAAAASLPLPMALAQPAAYPTRLVRLVLPTNPGGGTDVLARIIGDVLSKRLGQPVIVENRGGAAGVIGIEQVARAAPDGYSILFMTSAFTILPNIHKKLPYDPIDSFIPITRLTSVPHFLLVGAGVPASSVAELVALAKTKPGALDYASQSQGTSSHLACELFQKRTGIRMTHIPYNGAAAALTALIGGQVSVLFSTPTIAEPHIRAGKVKLLAVTSLQRSSLFPDVPTLDEAGVRGFEATQWHGVWVPAATPQHIVARLHAEFTAMMTLPDLIAGLKAEGAEPIASTQEQFSNFVKAEIRKWGDLVRSAGLQLS